jgi:hypothetical protein
MFFMAWSPVRRTNAGRFEVDHPGDYATLNSYHPSYGTHPFAIHFDFIVVANHSALGWTTIHQVAARALAVISLERRVEVPMPFVVACPEISFLRWCTYQKKY